MNVNKANDLQWMSEQVKAATAGNQQAQGNLYNATYNNVYLTLKSMIRNEDVCLDLLQDSYIKAFTSMQQLGDPAKFNAWVKSIARNKALDYLRSSRTVTFTDLAGDNEDFDPMADVEETRTYNMPEDNMDQQETARLVREILEELPEGQRAVIGMYYYQELSTPEIAQQLGLSEGAVRAQLSNGRKKIEVKVRDLAKRGTKLYGLTPFSFFLWRFSNWFAAPDQEILYKVLRRVPHVGTLSAEAAGAMKAAGVAKAAGAAKAVAAGKAVGTFAAGKLIAGIICGAALIGGAVFGGVKLAQMNKQEQPETVVSQAVEEESVVPEQVEEQTMQEAEQPAESSREERVEDTRVWVCVSSTTEFFDQDRAIMSLDDWTQLATTVKTYDILGNPVEFQTTYKQGTKEIGYMAYEYDEMGNPTTIRSINEDTVFDNVFTYEYDEEGRIISKTQDGGPARIFEYDVNEDGTLAGYTETIHDEDGTVVTEVTFTYNEKGQMVTMESHTFSEEYGVDTWETYTYEYGGSGNIAKSIYTRYHNSYGAMEVTVYNYEPMTQEEYAQQKEVLLQQKLEELEPEETEAEEIADEDESEEVGEVEESSSEEVTEVVETVTETADDSSAVACEHEYSDDGGEFLQFMLIGDNTVEYIDPAQYDSQMRGLIGTEVGDYMRLYKGFRHTCVKCGDWYIQTVGAGFDLVYVDYVSSYEWVDAGKIY